MDDRPPEAELCEVRRGDGPLLATAIHDGHELRPEVARLTALSDSARLREEDPHTSVWTTVAETRVVARRSRFEVDINRPRDKAVYRVPDDAWGLELWKESLPDDVAERSLAEYDAFYDVVRTVLDDLEQRFGSFVVLDLHSYNHRRGGPDAPPADPAGNPVINIGTGTMDRARWAGLVDRFIDELRTHEVGGRPLDVRENVRFKGGNLSRWVHETYPERGCALAVEFKKVFMDEWTGEVDHAVVDQLHDALAATVPGLLQSLGAR